MRPRQQTAMTKLFIFIVLSLAIASVIAITEGHEEKILQEQQIMIEPDASCLYHTDFISFHSKTFF